MYQRLRKAYASFVTLRECFDTLMIHRLDRAHGHNAVKRLFAFCAPDIAGITNEIEEAADGHFTVSRRMLSKVTHTFTDAYGVFANVMPADGGRAAVWFEKTGQYFHRGAFPRPVGSEESEHLPSLHIERYVVDRDYRPELTAKLINAYHFHLRITHITILQLLIHAAPDVRERSRHLIRTASFH
jgi:hypothetical protein